MVLDWILENWKLLASFFCDLVVFLYAFIVHAKSTGRIEALNSPLAALLDSSKAILEVLNNEKKNK